MNAKSHNWQVIHSSADQCWRTPPALFESLHSEFGFTLDAAALRDSALCAEWFGPDHDDPTRRDALSALWQGVVWCNPPYGRGVGTWVSHAHRSAAAGATVVMLLMANTDTTYFHKHCMQATQIRFVERRVKFLRADGSPAAAAPKGSMIVVFTPVGNVGTPQMTAQIQPDTIRKTLTAGADR